jgi:hypothetical protein
MRTTLQKYGQFLLHSQIKYTCDYLANATDGEISGDDVERFLKKAVVKPSFIWERLQSQIVLSPNGRIIFDDSVMEHQGAKMIENAYKQYCGNTHSIITGIGVINCVYYNPELQEYWLIDFRIYDKKKDGHTKIDHAKNMLSTAIKRFEKLRIKQDQNIINSSSNPTKQPTATSIFSVLFDGAYASKEFMNFIALDLNLFYYTNLKKSQLCNDQNGLRYSDGSVLKQIQELEWTTQIQDQAPIQSNQENKNKNKNKINGQENTQIQEKINNSLETGKVVRLKDFPKKHLIKLFQIAVTKDRIDNLATNNLDDSITAFTIQEETCIRWRIEQFHRETKQLTGINKCQCRKARSQRNHIAIANIVWLTLHNLSKKLKTTMYKVKHNLLDDYMAKMMDYPVYSVV